MVRIISVSSLPPGELSRTEMADGWFNGKPPKRKVDIYLYQSVPSYEPQVIDEGLDLYFQELDE